MLANKFCATLQFKPNMATELDSISYPGTTEDTSSIPGWARIQASGYSYI